MRFIVIILISLVMLTSCIWQPPLETPEDAIRYYYLTYKKDKDTSNVLYFIDKCTFNDKILVFYKYNERYIFQWVIPDGKSFIARSGLSEGSTDTIL